MALPRWNAADLLATVAVVCLGCPWTVLAQFPQGPPAHYRHHANMPPGAIGSWQLQRGGPYLGYFQPVEFYSPEGAQIALAAGGQFEPPAPRVLAGLLIGQVYRLRVTNIPRNPGAEVYPTLEVIDRTFPPAHVARQFPIPVEISLADLELALVGKYVTRVVYLEDPRNALPVAGRLDRQEWFETRPGQDPLRVADDLGRPMAILRIGGRTPEDTARPSAKFLYGSPPFKKLPARWKDPPPPKIEPKPKNKAVGLR